MGAIDVVVKWTADTAGAKSGMEGATKVIADAESKTKSLDTATKRYTKTLEDTKNKFKLFGLIGLGTMAALFVNTPILAAGFNLIRTSLLTLFIAMQSKILPVFTRVAKAINRVTRFLKEHPTILKWVTVFTALLASIAVGVAIFTALGAAISAISGGFVILTGVFGPTLVAIFTALGAAILAISGKFVIFVGVFGHTLTALAGIVTGAGLLTIAIAAIGAVIAGLMFAKFITNMKEGKGFFDSFAGAIVDTLGNIIGFFADITSKMLEFLGFERAAEIFGGIADFLRDDLWENAKAGFWLFIGDVETGFRAIGSALAAGIKFGLNIAIGLLNAVIGGMNLVPGVSIPRIPSLQMGGLITKTGIAKVERGEQIIPAGGGGDTFITVDFAGARFDISSPQNIRDSTNEMVRKMSRVQAKLNRGV